MRLIDADALRISMMCRFDEIAELLEIIDEQPTAYDVDKVCEELDICSAINFGRGNAYDTGKMDAYDDAIDIVRRGGVND